MKLVEDVQGGTTRVGKARCIIVDKNEAIMSDFINEERRGPRPKARPTCTRSCLSSVRACEEDVADVGKSPTARVPRQEPLLRPGCSTRGAPGRGSSRRACLRGSQSSSSSPLLFPVARGRQCALAWVLPRAQTLSSCVSASGVGAGLVRVAMEVGLVL